MAAIKISDASFQAVPVFPLGGQSLFPHMSLPLRIFEPRYVEMVEYALDHNKLIAIADVNSTQDKPALPPILGAGLIVHIKPRPGKMFDMILLGITRVGLIEEHPQVRGFRQAKAEILIDEEESEQGLLELDLNVRDLILQLSERRPDDSEALESLLQQATSPLLLSEMSAARLLQDRARQRQAFGTLSTSKRLEVIADGLGALLMKGSPTDDGEH